MNTNRRFKISLRFQLLFFLTLLIGTTMGITGFWIIRQQQEELTDILRKKGQATANQLAAALREVATDKSGFLYILKQAKQSDSDVVEAIMVKAATGEILGAVNLELMGKKVSPSFPSFPETIDFSAMLSGEGKEAAQIRVWMSTKPITEAVNRVQRGITEVTLLFLVVAILASIILAERIVQPVKRLMAGVAEMGKGHFDIVVPVTTRNEIGELTSAFNATAKSLKEKEHLKSVAKSYMGQEVMEQAMSVEGDLQLGGERRLVTILFSDIRDFTAMSEKMKPEEVVTMLNEYFSEMTAIVVKNGGVVDKFMGDAIMAVYGIPKPRADHAELAVKTSVEMLQRLQALHQEWETKGKPIIKMGIGLNTGEVVVGNIGSQDRMSYTIIGDPANVASRVQALNKTYHTTLLLTDRTYEAVVGKVPHVLQPVEKVQIRGRSEPVQLYTIRV